ncbi:MAG: hypothetical protein WBD05_03865, partial [Phycisphaerae bacterium]
FNENWLLRLVLDWFSEHDVGEHPLAFSEGARWFSEALLPSAFLSRRRGDTLAESWTHADGLIGHFQIGGSGRGDLRLLQDASQLVVLEGKIFSRLSPGVKNAPFYDQAARNVGCTSEVLRRANRRPDDMRRLAFHVLAPESQIKDGVFAAEVTAESIRRKVERRVDEYGGERDQWLHDWFEPTMQHIDIACLTWESLVEDIVKTDRMVGDALRSFYDKCLLFNGPAKRK